MSEAPKRLCVDLTSEDKDGIFMAARPARYLNIDEMYVHISDYENLEKRLQISRELSDFWETKFHNVMQQAKD